VESAYVLVAEDLEENGQELAQDGQDLVLGEVRLDELGEDGHRTVHRRGRVGGEERDEGVQQVRVFVRPVRVCN
jgi:hypothetical protein